MRNLITLLVLLPCLCFAQADTVNVDYYLNLDSTSRNKFLTVDERLPMAVFRN